MQFAYYILMVVDVIDPILIWFIRHRRTQQNTLTHNQFQKISISYRWRIIHRFVFRLSSACSAPGFRLRFGLSSHSVQCIDCPFIPFISSPMPFRHLSVSFSFSYGLSERLCIGIVLAFIQHRQPRWQAVAMETVGHCSNLFGTMNEWTKKKKI